MKRKVLVLDEDLLALELYSRELRNDFHIFTSDNVPAARQCLETQGCEILIIEPAVQDGWGFLREVRSGNKPPLVIVCSVEDDRRKGFSAGVNAFLVKPVLPATLHAMLIQMIASPTKGKVE